MASKVLWQHRSFVEWEELYCDCGEMDKFERLDTNDGWGHIQFRCACGRITTLAPCEFMGMLN